MDYEIAEDGLLANLLAFNVGVEIGQLLALAVILIAMSHWRLGTCRRARFASAGDHPLLVIAVIRPAGTLRPPQERSE